MSQTSTTTATTVLRPAPRAGRAYARRYWAFAVPAAAVVLPVILFPWIFTLFMSVHDWKVSAARRLRRPRQLRAPARATNASCWAIVRTLYFTALAGASLPMLLGVLGGGLLSTAKFPLRGLARTSSSCR